MGNVIGWVCKDQVDAVIWDLAQVIEAIAVDDGIIPRFDFCDLVHITWQCTFVSFERCAH